MCFLLLHLQSLPTVGQQASQPASQHLQLRLALWIPSCGHAITSSSPVTNCTWSQLVELYKWMLNWRRHPATKRQQRIYLKIAACHLANTLHFYLPICLTLLLWAPLPVNYWTVPAAAVDLAVCREEGSILLSVRRTNLHHCIIILYQ